MSKPPPLTCQACRQGFFSEAPQSLGATFEIRAGAVFRMRMDMCPTCCVLAKRAFMLWLKEVGANPPEPDLGRPDAYERSLLL